MDVAFGLHLRPSTPTDGPASVRVVVAFCPKRHVGVLSTKRREGVSEDLSTLVSSAPNCSPKKAFQLGQEGRVLLNP